MQENFNFVVHIRGLFGTNLVSDHNHLNKITTITNLVIHNNPIGYYG